MPAIDDLTAQVDRLEQAATSVVTKLEQLVAQGTVDPATLDALTARLQSVSDKLEAAAA